MYGNVTEPGFVAAYQARHTTNGETRSASRQWHFIHRTTGARYTARTQTPAAAATLALKADRTTLAADGADATVVDVQALDAEGDEAAASEDFVFFECEGPGKIIGVGNGNPLSHEDDVCADGRWKRRLFNGKCQCVLKAGNRPGELRLRVRLASTGAVSEVVVSIAEPTPGRP